MADFVRRVCGGVADTHAGILTEDRYGQSIGGMRANPTPAFSHFARAVPVPHRGRGRFVGWGLPHRRTTVAMRQTVRRGAPYGGFRA